MEPNFEPAAVLAVRVCRRPLPRVRAQRFLPQVRAVDSTSAHTEPYQTRTLVRYGECSHAGVLRLHHLKARHGVD